ncbi:MAG: NAD(P)/FAD-dependent oxidoreductase [Sinobacteraceae bacterium]|nr:NAD(P)/FAD-dependent oxidoreductase [Nevskiaceae bacterium]
MIRISELSLPLDAPDGALRAALLQRLRLHDDELLEFTVFKRSYDARKKHAAIHFVYVVDLMVRDEPAVLQRCADDPRIGPAPDTRYRVVAQAPAKLSERPLVVGFGPGGLFAALLLAQMGFRPIVLERGREVRRRTQDTWGLWRGRVLDPVSNVQFGEGGAGLFSDGKLYSQIKDPKFHGRKVLQEFVQAGAPEEILYIGKPHIGTFRLTGVVARMREQIIALGGEVRFESQVVDLLLDDGQIEGVTLASGEVLRSRHVVLALGHSARDTFRMLAQRGVWLEPKPFAIGLRIEHPQSLIDRARFGRHAGHPALGAADYKLVHHARNGRAVYSFCMCPGGTVVAATSEPGRVVTNGMSQYSRNERNANAGIVVAIEPQADYPGGPLAGIELQERLEAQAYLLGGADYNAPGQLIGDFLRGVPSTAFGEVEPSYQPGVRLGDLSTALPPYAIEAIREALPAFGRQIPGFDRDDAVFTGVETRTSSPLRITRDPATLHSLNVRGLFPCGEGAGYAGGILSAGVDGIRVAEAVALSLCGAHQPLASEIATALTTS